MSEYPGQEENIERFCLPLFAKAGSDYVLEHVLSSFQKRPAMTQLYAAYVAKFMDKREVRKALWLLLGDRTLVDWQKMWILAALSQSNEHHNADFKLAMPLFQDANRHDALRAVAAIFVGRFGDHARRKAIGSAYATVSPYIQAAILFSSRRWPAAERNTAKVSWGALNPLNSLISIAMTKK